MSMWAKIRRAEGLTQKEMGERLGLNRMTIYNYEKGNTKMPKEIQIEYLKLRNSDEDKIIINYLKEML